MQQSCSQGKRTAYTEGFYGSVQERREQQNIISNGDIGILKGSELCEKNKTN